MATAITNVRDDVSRGGGRGSHDSRAGGSMEFGKGLTAVAGCFAQRETRATAAELVAGLVKVDTRNGWTITQALGPPTRTGSSTCCAAPCSTTTEHGRRSPAWLPVNSRVRLRQHAPELVELLGVGPITAAQILVSWPHPGRFRSEAAFASFAGVAPIPVSSGLANKHRLNRGGDRQLNRAMHTISLIRM